MLRVTSAGNFFSEFTKETIHPKNNLQLFLLVVVVVGVAADVFGIFTWLLHLLILAVSCICQPLIDMQLKVNLDIAPKGTVETSRNQYPEL